MNVDYLIIGQGITGTFLSYYLQKENKSILVIDEIQSSSPSRIAAGIINPVTGRRMVTVWMADEVLPFAWKAYQELGHDLGIDTISQKSIIDFFPGPFMRESFLKRLEENDQYLHAYPEQNDFNPFFKFDFGCGEIRPVYMAHLETVLPAWRNNLVANRQLKEEHFDISQLEIMDTGVRYKDIHAGIIIFCDGINGAENPYFKPLPFAPNKGEVLIVEIPGLPDNHIYKKNITLAPLDKPGLFWLGSIYLWEYENLDITQDFRNKAESILKEWIRIPFRIVDHLAGLRPATLERRPFVGLHPQHKQIGILNGMGTKGCSLAPYFARQLADHLLFHMDITPEADVRRFSKILAR